MNLIDYVTQENDSEINLLNEVDALVLTMASYFEFEKVITIDQCPIKVNTIDYKGLLEANTSRLRRQHNLLIQSLITSKRFEPLVIIDFRSDLDLELEKQFAAITFRVNDKIFVAFRGTDFSPVGWKEDFNMSFSKDVPAQQSALEYLNHTAAKLKQPLILGGHSKGGNLAVYAGALSDSSSSIQKIFNFDGPGFRTEFIQTKPYQDALLKTVKYVPHASIVGSLLDSDILPIIVESKNFSIFQHNAYEWVIDKTHFVQREEVTSTSKHFSTSLQEWMEEIPDEKRKYVIDEIYEGFKQLNIDSLEDIWAFLSLDTIKNVFKIHSQADPEFKEEVGTLLKQFIKQMF